MKKKKVLKVTAIFLLWSFLCNLFFPTVALALTSGPASPEFSSFEPVATTDMVNIFSGDLTYNLPVLEVPGPDGGGYAMSLSYHSGASCEEEASWVGFGWSLNPGALNRSVRGIPDEWNGDDIDYYNKTRPNWTLAASHKFNFEFFSQDELKKVNAQNPTYMPQARELSFSAGTALRYNNYMGFNRSYSLGAKFGGMASLDMQVSSAGITFSADINPLKILNRSGVQFGKKFSERMKTLVGPVSPGEKNKKRMFDKLNSKMSGGSAYGYFTFAEGITNVSVPTYHGYNINYSLSMMTTPSPTPIGVEYGTTGTFSMQSNDPKRTVDAYGYMHNQQIDPCASNCTERMEDYYVEKSQPFDKRDYFIGIPFSNEDNYILTGEGLSGGFRYHDYDVGHFAPNKVESNLKIFNLGVGLELGWDVGVGLTLGFGIAKTQIRNWKDNSSSNMTGYNFLGSGGAFVFDGDLGSNLTYGTPALSTASIDKNPDFPGIKSAYPHINSDVQSTLSNSSPLRTSSYIDASTEPGAFIISNEDGTTYKYGGSNATVMSRNETNISVDAESYDEISNKYLVRKALHMDQIGSDYVMDLCDVNHDATHNAIVGEGRKSTLVPSTYLLSEIRNSDYVDADLDNIASESDFGGWTKFEYYQKTWPADPDNPEWYRWRAPYTGLIYQRNQVSDTKDDMGSVSTGQKQIYYLKKIETKSHIAYFVTNQSDPGRWNNPAGVPSAFLTGSGTPRKDGLGAKELIVGDNQSDQAADDFAAKGAKDLEYLEKIVLFAKNRPDKPIKTVYFEYGNYLVPNLPNNTVGAFPLNDPDHNNSGKLTLKRVWTEYDGTVGAKISPYEFKYVYKSVASYPTDLVNNNSNLASFFNLSTRYSDADQNPEYRPYLLDAWGNNQARAAQRHDNENPWLYQGKFDPNEQFDPAAWQLKQIKLPSGGEILIEYEQKDYSAVQDRIPMAMAHLVDYNINAESSGEDYGNRPKYSIDPRDVGVDPGVTTEMDALKHLIIDYYVTQGNKIYFKFLYALRGAGAQLDDCKSEYIDGYAKVWDDQSGNYPGVTIDNSTTPYSIKIILDGDGSGFQSDGYVKTPRQACYDFYSTQRVGKFEQGCEGVYESWYDNTVEKIASDDYCSNTWTNSVWQVIRKFGFATGAIVSFEVMSVPDLRIQPPLHSDVGTHLNVSGQSYMKIPMTNAKRGGGIRVKRLLMYDPGIETGDAVIYGSQYNYIQENGVTSGVATTEPASMREENPLVGFLPKKSQSWTNRHISGNDKEQSEGPIGESVLPPASVGHSRVIVQNVHTGKTGTGFTVHKFFTVKDFPFDGDYNYSSLTGTANTSSERKFDFAAIAGSSEKGVAFTNLADNSFKDYLSIPAGFFNYSHTRQWAGQGFRFIINEMHGQPASVNTYYGDPTGGNPDLWPLSAGTTYEYYKPGEKVKLLSYDSNTDEIKYKYDVPGKSMNITMESKNIRDNTMDFGLEVDLSVGIAIPPPIFVTFFPTISISDAQLSTHATTKVIRYPVILKSVESFKDGISAKTENLAFDRATGKPLVTRSTDSYHGIPIPSTPFIHDGSYYSLNMPAHWYYPTMDARSLNGTNSNQLSAMAGNIVTYGLNGNPIDYNYNNTNDEGVFYFPSGTSAITDKVISASANTYSNDPNWFDAIVQSEYGIGLSALSSLNAMKRPEASYVYKTDIKQASYASTAKVFDGGTYNSFVPFDYATPASSDPSWIMVNKVTRYSPHGGALEEEDNLGIPSAAKYGYRFSNSNTLPPTMPVMVAKNAEHATIYFEDFESPSPFYLSFISPDAHSGTRSLILPNGGQFTFLIAGTTRLQSSNAILRLWVKNISDYKKLHLSYGSVTDVEPKKLAQSGQWMLLSYSLNGPDIPLSYPNPTTITITNTDGSILIDDVRFEPADAQSTCFVYDIATLKPSAQFDDQHFGTYYVYNGEGKLVRKIVETERGLKTIQENSINKSKVDRP